jgi:hypothetical protein
VNHALSIVFVSYKAVTLLQNAQSSIRAMSSSRLLNIQIDASSCSIILRNYRLTAMLSHNFFRTKALVLELLAAICLVKGGHEIILSAFDNFKEVCSERRRFTTLMAYFTQYDSFHIEFMVACMQFVNIVVHSVEDMNFRVHLQYEFTKLGLDEYLEKLRHTESEDLQVNKLIASL